MTIFSRVAATAAMAATALLAAVASGEHVQFKIRNGELASRAVNLGGWLVSEYWMAFSSPLYEGVPASVGLAGEYAVMQHLGRTKGAAQFEQHWQTFITEDDLKQIASYGLNTVRVTVGFWIVSDDPNGNSTDQSALTRAYPSGSLKHLDKLVNDWAEKYDLAVMVSLHAHRGSQNGFDNSAPETLGTIAWHEDPANAKSSLDFATFVAHRYKDSPAFLGLNLMNEPKSPISYDLLKKYYLDAYAAIRADGNDCIIVTSPWLENQGPPTMSDFMTCPDYYNVWHEFHVYYKWGWEGVATNDMLAQAAGYADSHFKPWTGNPIYMGEWSLATTDEVQLSKAELQQFARSQLTQYDEQAQGGWAFWAWRHDEEATKGPSGWSMRQLLKEKIISVPSTPATRTRNPKCKAVFSHSSNASSSSSASGSSSSGSAGSANSSAVEFVTPEATTSNAEKSNNATGATSVAPAPSSAAAPASATMAIASSAAATVLVTLASVLWN